MVKSKRAREAVEVEAEDVPVVEQTDAPAKKRKRSEDEPASGDVKKKAKKDKKKDKKETRKEKKDKRKDLQDLPEEEADEEEQPQAAEPEKMDVDVTAADESKKEKKDKKKDKKEKKNKDKEDKKTDGDETVKKDKKDKKDKKKKNKTEEAQENGASKPVDEEKPAEDEGEAAADGKADRHIVFVGNLPYSATSASITAHFASLSPISVRCLTKREDPTACRGIAFVEFGKVWHMRTCLDKFHHSMFNDGISEPRKINVELTAGGGGKTKQRKDKIMEKNKKLDENRAKRIEREKTAKEESKSGGQQQQQQQQDTQDYIHPSRRARVPGQKW